MGKEGKEGGVMKYPSRVNKTPYRYDGWLMAVWSQIIKWLIALRQLYC